MNLSQIRDPRRWKRWRHAGALGGMLEARARAQALKNRPEPVEPPPVVAEASEPVVAEAPEEPVSVPEPTPEAAPVAAPEPAPFLWNGLELAAGRTYTGSIRGRPPATRTITELRNAEEATPEGVRRDRFVRVLYTDAKGKSKETSLEAFMRWADRP